MSGLRQHIIAEIFVMFAFILYVSLSTINHELMLFCCLVLYELFFAIKKKKLVIGDIVLNNCSKKKI